LAYAFRSISVDLHNNIRDPGRAVAAHVLAGNLCSDDGLRERLRQDAAALSGFYGSTFMTLGTPFEAPTSPTKPGESIPRPPKAESVAPPSVPSAASYWNGLSGAYKAGIAVAGLLALLFLAGLMDRQINFGQKTPSVLSPSPQARKAALPMAMAPPPTPAPTSQPPVRLKNGTVVRRFVTTGLGRFQIENGTDLDAIVVVVEQEVVNPDRAALYVRANSTATLGAIPVGSYRLAFELGRNWDRKTKRFHESMVKSMFDKVAQFEETPSDLLDGRPSVLYNTYRATLHGVKGGNAPTRPADPSLLIIGDEQ
jgi:hypothetical protein